MPRVKRFSNAFTKEEVSRITRLSLPMIDYAARHGFFDATYRDNESGKSGRTSGRVRYFSYRDLVVARIIQRLRESGIRISRLKKALSFLQTDEAWGLGSAIEAKAPQDAVRWLVTDGKEIQLKAEDGFLDELKVGGQRSFSFIVGIEATKTEVLHLLGADERRDHFTMENKSLRRAAN